jgi:hypothetical protein
MNLYHVYEINLGQAQMPSTQLSQEKSCCTTRRSCCRTETNGNPKLRPLPAQMHLTDKRDILVLGSRSVYISRVVVSDTAT